ncbi:unnamed protein product [Trichobilharzia szidati]|nr:unnamed protein product [Trichobilharzia szidati]
MSGEGASFDSSRKLHLSNRNLFLLWMIADTALMILITIGMIVMVNNEEEVNEWIRVNSWVTIILIILGCVPILILVLVKALGNNREIDHYLIGFSYILCSMGFATLFRVIDVLYASISSGVTLVATALVIFIAVNVRRSTMLTIIIFVFVVIALIVGAALHIVQISTDNKHIAYRIGVAVCFGIAVASVSSNQLSS